MGRPARLFLILVVSTASACGPTPSGPGSPAPAPTATAAASAPSPIASAGPTETAPQILVVATVSLKLPAGVSRAVAFADSQTVLLAGGLTRAGTTSAVLRLDLAGAVVATVGHLALAVHDAGGAMVGGSSMVFGGGNLVPGRTVQRAGPGAGAVVGSLPVARADLSAVDLGGQAFVIGGGTPARLDPAVLTTADGVHFKAFATLLDGVRYPAVAVADGFILAIGGTDGTRDLADIQLIDPGTGSVRVIGHLSHGLSHAAALVVGGHLLVAGGRSGGIAQDTIWDVDPVTGNATQSGRLPAAVSDAAAIVVEGVGYLIGGETDEPVASIVSIRFD